ncbi:hypothetical protein UREOM_0370 [Ureaplasma sp. OM1]|uniref:Transmembrane protein n=2 Tax=Ureaplasma ceti TaxID=3119530 RepID=A0ABP9U8Y6_9BACT
MLSIGLQAVLMLVSSIYYFTQTTPSDYFKKNDLQFQNVNLVVKPDKEHPNGIKKINVVAYKGKPITSETIIDYNKVSDFPAKLSRLGEYYWKEAINASNYYQTGYGDIENQFIDMYRLYSSKFYKNYDVDQLLWFINASEFRGWRLQINDVNLNQFIVDNHTQTLNKNKLILTYNNYMFYNFGANRKGLTILPNTIQSVYEMNKTNGWTFPIYDLDSQTGLWKTKTFNSINEFSKYYYSGERLEQLNQLMNNWRSFSKHKFLPSTYYYSPILQNLCAKNTTNNFDDFTAKQRNEFLLKFFGDSIKFAQATYLAMQEYYANPNKFPWINKSILEIMASNLNLNIAPLAINDSINNNGMGAFIYNKPVFMANLHNDWHGQNIQLQTLQTNLPLSLLESEKLTTGFTANIQPEYNPYALILGWLAVGIIFIFFGVAMYVRTDVA